MIKETKKAAKARMIAEKLAERARIKEEKRHAVFSTPVAIAVEPLRVDAIKVAEEEGYEYIKGIEAHLEKFGWDIDLAAPRGDYRREPIPLYKVKEARRKQIEFLTVDKEKNRPYYSKDPRIVEICVDRVVRFIEIEKEMAAAQYEGFVYKLVSKIADHTSASLDPEAAQHGAVWGRSILTITKPDGSIQRWKTQRIFNRSVYGKIFMQWPTRLMKNS